MNDLNSVALVARLVRDPEVRHLPSGDPVLTMRVAFSTRMKMDDGWGDKSNFIDVTVFGRQAESLGNNLAKGRRIGVAGSLSWREWQTKEGEKRQAVSIIARDVHYLDSRLDGEAPAPSSAPKSSGLPASEVAAAFGATVVKADEDIPFAPSYI